MGSPQLWVGLDVGESATAICILAAEGNREREVVTPSRASDIAAALSGYEDCIAAVAMETGAPYELNRQLRQLGFPVLLLDAGKVQRYLSIRQNKTDINDARGIAEIARHGDMARLTVYVRDRECQNLRQLLVVREQLIRQRTASRNALRSLLRGNGSDLKQISIGRRFRPIVEAEFAGLPPGVPEQLLPLLEICEAQAKLVAKIDKRVAQFAVTNPIIQRFMKIPGIGALTAVSFYSSIENPHRFTCARNVGAYLGIIPKVKQSGAAVQRSRISRAGNTMTRGHLVMAAGVLLSRAAKGCAIRDWGAQLRAKSGYGKARVAVARKLAVAMLSMWKSDREFDPYPARSP